MFVYMTYLVYRQVYLHYECVSYDLQNSGCMCTGIVSEEFLDALFVVYYIQHQENRHSEFLSVCMFQIITFCIT
jgi:hypothetical protein